MGIYLRSSYFIVFAGIHCCFANQVVLVITWLGAECVVH